jgi:IMP dehydrogenase
VAVPLLTLAAWNRGIGAEVLIFTQHFLPPEPRPARCFRRIVCTGQFRNNGLVIGCNPYP